MNRRAFLTGLAATTAATGFLPPLPANAHYDAELWYNQWFADALPVFTEAYSNLILYGSYAIAYVEDYPYIKVIPSEELYIGFQ